MATVTTAAVARRAPQQAPLRDQQRRPDLRVVGVGADRRRIGYLVAGALAVAMFLIVTFQMVLNSGQAHIDDVNGRIVAAQEHALELRLELAELQSPQYVTTAATTRLGMIPAPTPVYLQARATDDQRAAELPPASAPTVKR